ncbi:regulator of G-protein signaling rgs-2 [Atheta coriaria]|uniref:regulator of G-protein signaling rgs-2 n=1 Tax=Dalotia coriaria TaxID=877792 RepID=UPI0031F429E2
MSCSVSERLPENRAGAGGGGCRPKGSSNTSLATPPNSKGGGQQGAASAGGNGPLRQRPCRLCWCCCCSCCSTPGKGSDENGPTKVNSEGPNIDGDPPPSLEEIRSWGRSFDKLMRSSAGRKVFREFLKCEYSEENILFWLACEELKKETSPEAIEEKARIIYEDFISILSPREVSLDSRVREIVNRNMVEPIPATFDEAQLQIYTLMHRDSYPRFVNSSMYKSLVQQAGGGDAADSASMLLDNDGAHG